jgi:CheY-like chemotaxis protein
MSDFLQSKKTMEASIAQMKILYVEDEEDIRNNLARIIRRRTKQLLLASNGKEGLKLYKKEHPDIIITDIRMPVMDGMDMMEAIRKGVGADEALTKNTGSYGRFKEAVKTIDPRKE